LEIIAHRGEGRGVIGVSVPPGGGTLGQYAKARERSRAELATGQRDKSTQIIRPLSSSANVMKHELKHGKWAYSDTFLQSLVWSTYPTFDSDPKEFKKARQLMSVLYHRLRRGITAEKLAEETGRSESAIESEFNRATQRAKSMLKGKYGKLKPEQPDNEPKKKRGCRVLVKTGKVVASDFATILSLAALPYKNVRTQAGLALLEHEETRTALDGVVQSLKSLRRKAA
jgi:hypothetical protein